MHDAPKNRLQLLKEGQQLPFIKRLCLPMEGLGVDEVARWLVDSVHLPQYEQAFRDDEVDGDVLLDLVANQLLGHLVGSPVHQSRIRAAAANFARRAIAEPGAAEEEAAEAGAAPEPAEAKTGTWEGSALASPVRPMRGSVAELLDLIGILPCPVREQLLHEVMYGGTGASEPPRCAVPAPHAPSAAPAPSASPVCRPGARHACAAIPAAWGHRA